MLQGLCWVYEDVSAKKLESELCIGLGLGVYVVV